MNPYELIGFRIFTYTRKSDGQSVTGCNAYFKYDLYGVTGSACVETFLGGQILDSLALDSSKIGKHYYLIYNQNGRLVQVLNCDK